MELYYSPLACSLATRIAFYEAGADAAFVQVDPVDKRLPDGSDYRALCPLGLVPALRTDEGLLLTENVAVLQYIAARDSTPGSQRMDELCQWLSFIGTELHKGIFSTLFDANAPEISKRYVLDKGKGRLEHIDHHMAGREFVLVVFSVADAYLYTVLNWVRVTPIELDDYPALQAYHRRVAQRPSVKRAFAEELPLYLAEQENQH